MPVAALVEAGGIFGIRAGSIRVALARLMSDARIERDGRARYRLGPASTPVETLVRSWRHLDRRIRPWSGAWLGVQLGSGAARADRSRSLRALRLLGFAPLASGLQLRPSNLRVSPAETRETLSRLGLEAAAVSCELQDLDARAQSAALELWDLEALSEGYRATRGRLEASAAGLSKRTAEAAMAESFLLGGQAIGQLVQDPLLPEEILPTQERDALVEAMRAYDALGRAAWSTFLDRFGVKHRRAPQDTRLTAGLDRRRA